MSEVTSDPGIAPDADIWARIYYPIHDALDYRLASVGIVIGGEPVQMAVSNESDGFVYPKLPLLCSVDAECDDEAEYVTVEDGSVVGITCLRHGPEASLCVDCRMETFPSEHYMVHDDLWPTEVGRNGGMICIGCLEQRLGRQLTAADFTAAPINTPDTWTSARLKDRLLGPGVTKNT